MAIKTSTGLRNSMLVTGSFRSIMDGASLKIYSGTPPLTADDALGSQEPNTELAVITNNGTATGLTFNPTASNGEVTKTTGEVWKDNSVVGGTARFYRLVTAADTGASSATEPRVQGLIGTSGADLNLTSTTLVNAAAQVIDYYSIALPSA